MPKGQVIPELQLSTLQKYIEKNVAAPSMVLSNKFPVNNAPSDTIEWESRYGSAEMIPFVARGSRGPSFGDDGTAMHSAKAAYFAQDKFYGEEFLNNLRQPGTREVKMRGQQEIARGLRRMATATDRRREWMFAKMLFDGSMTYTIKGTSATPSFATVSWGIPTSHQVTKGSTSRWYGTSGETADRNVFSDVFTMKNKLQDSLEIEVTNLEMYMNSKLIQSLILDSGIRDLAQTQNMSEAYIKNNATTALATILGVGSIQPYDASYHVNVPLAQAYSSGTTIYVTDASDLVVGGTVWIKNTVDGAAGATTTISAINTSTGAVTLTAALTGSTGTAFKSQLVMRKYFLADNKIVGVVPSVDGTPIAEMLQSPYGMDGVYGKRMRSLPEEYPDGIRLVSEDLCLPVIYYPAAVYQLVVGA